jgi:hypothetical protein
MKFTLEISIKNSSTLLTQNSSLNIIGESFCIADSAAQAHAGRIQQIFSQYHRVAFFSKLAVKN